MRNTLQCATREDNFRNYPTLLCLNMECPHGKTRVFTYKFSKFTQLYHLGWLHIDEGPNPKKHSGLGSN